MRRSRGAGWFYPERAVRALEAAVAVALVAGCAGGCASGAQTGSGGGRTAGVSAEASAEAPVTAVRSIAASEVAPPPMRFKEFRLPGLHKLGGVGTRIAAFAGPDATVYGDAPIVLMDLETGRHAVGRPHAVGWEERYGVLGLRCSDSWVVWEELRGDEAEEPLDCDWKLYAAPVDAKSLKLGEPVLVAESVVSIQSRPMFVVLGDEVFWMTNSAPNPKQEGTIRGARISARRLPNGPVRTVVESRHNFASISESEGKLLVCELPSKDSKSEVLHVVDPKSGAVERSLDLRNGEAEVSHLPKVHGGLVAWAVMPDAETDETMLLVATGTGGGRQLDTRGMDPVLVGPYVVYETLSRDAGPGGTPRLMQRIRGYDPRTREVFTIAESDADKDGAWQLWMWQGYDPERFVMTKKSVSGSGKPVTIVRVYEIDR
ncbi:MAG: hypothetical protein QMD96_03805 [Anaerosomatales bacterium]|nr:hypothetical protein [Anaerosomatales bacterium]